MGNPLSGFQDKLYWRYTSQGYHCFKKIQRTKGQPTAWMSLCGRYTIYGVNGQHCGRPAPHLRCAICDGREMDRRGWSESGPESVTP